MQQAAYTSNSGH